MTALPLALAIILKTYPIIFLPLLLIRRQYLAAAWALGYTVTMTLVSLVVLPKRNLGRLDEFRAAHRRIRKNPLPPVFAGHALEPEHQRIHRPPFSASGLRPDRQCRGGPLGTDGSWPVAVIAALVWVSLRMNKRAPKSFGDEEIALVLTDHLPDRPLVLGTPLRVRAAGGPAGAGPPVRGTPFDRRVAIAVGLAAGILAWPLNICSRSRAKGP